MFTHLQHWRFIVYMRRRRKGVEIGDARNGGGRRLNVIYISIGMSPFLGAELYGGTDVNAAGNEYVSGLKLYYV